MASLVDKVSQTLQPLLPTKQPQITSLTVEHRLAKDLLGIGQANPRVSWTTTDIPQDYKQQGYEVEFYDSRSRKRIYVAKVDSNQSSLVPWPLDRPLKSREGVFLQVKTRGQDDGQASDFSKAVYVEAGLLERNDWKCKRIIASWEQDTSKPRPEELYRKQFSISPSKKLSRARLYITAQGVYEAEINGKRVGDHFLAPGWSVYSERLHYQTFDVLEHLSKENGESCIGVRVAEGWFCGRLAFHGGKRNIWGDRTALMAQLELEYEDGTVESVLSDESWQVAEGPIRLAEIYNGEKYDSNKELRGWSNVTAQGGTLDGDWSSAKSVDLPSSDVALLAYSGAPARRTETLQVKEISNSPSGKIIVDFGQNLVGYVRVKKVIAEKQHKISLFHAEVLEHGECARRPLRVADQLDEYTCSGDPSGESWEPRFTFHGFRYVQLEGWPTDIDPATALEAVVCHTDMQYSGDFDCDNEMLIKLHNNIRWGMRGNFLSVPTDCPQRDERLGWTGDIALFSPTACFLYDCVGMLQSWLADLAVEQKSCGGIPPIVVPDVLKGGMIPNAPPAAVWGDAATIVPWTLYQSSGDASILAVQYDSMATWLKNIPRDKVHNRSLYDPTTFQFGDWLDPSAPPNNPMEAKTDPILVANAFLAHSLDIMKGTASILEKTSESQAYASEAELVRQEFADEYVTKNGRLASDSQAGYALAICFRLFPTPEQVHRGGERLAELVRRNNFRIGTGFAGTPFVCEALVQTGHAQIAYRMLLEEKCPSWLYPVTMGATTMWERWDSMLPDGTINPGEMTSFNHYALGAVATFMHERLAGLKCIEPGWKKSRFEPVLGGEFKRASANHLTPYGNVSGSWEIGSGGDKIRVKLTVPPGTTMEVVLPGSDSSEGPKVVGPGSWTFEENYSKSYEWPPKPLMMFDIEEMENRKQEGGT